MGTLVTLGGTVSDYDGDCLSFTWTEEGNILFQGIVCPEPGGNSVQLPAGYLTTLGLGGHNLTLEVSDGFNPPVSEQVTIAVVDTTAPSLAPVPNTGILWPPDHRMVEIVIDANASDLSVTRVLSVGQISSNEAPDGLGDGSTSPDWTTPEIDQFNGIIKVQLRAERSAKGGGRVYTIPITATDSSGNSTTVAVTVKVPHDQRK